MQGLTKAVEQIYEQRRARAERIAADRRMEAYRKVPSLERVEEQVREESVAFLRRTLRSPGTAPDPAELESRLAELKAKRAELLALGGFPPDWLTPPWICPVCSDTGYTDAERRSLCDCSRQLLVDGRFNDANLSKDGQTGFDCYVDRWYPDAPNPVRYGTDRSPRAFMAEVRDHLAEWADAFDQPETKNLYLFGNTGTGKTFLCKAVGLRMLERGHSVLYISAPVLLDAIRACKFAEPDDLAMQREYRHFSQCDLLIIDDLGTDPASDARSADLLMLLEARMKPSPRPRRTIISTNLDLKRLYQSYNERIGSRIAGDFEIIRCIGEDIRLEKKKTVKN